MKKILFSTFLGLFALMLLPNNPAEARHHRHSSFHVGVGSGYAYGYNAPYVVRRYAPPPVVVAPVYVQPNYPAPVYAYPPAYVEEVYVAPAPRPLTFGGLSFSWNFFR